MTRTMYDSVTMGAIPTSAKMVAFYVDGLYANGTACKARFPNAIRVGIAVFPSTDDGVVLDCETGDATPSQCPGWVVKRRGHGVDPTVYCSESVWPQVQAAFAANKVAQPHYWIAAYPGIGQKLYAGSIAHQYADPPGSGGNFDLSIVADFWPGVDSNPQPPIKPPVSGRDPALVKRLQHVVRVTEDGFFGTNTAIATDRIIEGKVKADPKYLQWHCGLNGAQVDGIWGPTSEAARRATVRNIQTVISVPADGSWGPISQARYLTIFAANYLKG